MKFTTLISSTTPFINLLVALLLHNPSSSIVAANEDVFSFSTASSTTDSKNAEEESVIDLNPRRSLGMGSDKEFLSDLMPDKVDGYLNQALLDNCPYFLLGNVDNFVQYVLEPYGIVRNVTQDEYDGFVTAFGDIPSRLVSEVDFLSPDVKEYDSCEDEEFGFGGEFTKDICAARKKVVTMLCKKEPSCNEKPFDDSFRIRAAKSSYLNNPTTVAKLLCAQTSNFTNSCFNDTPTITKANGLVGLVNACLPERFNNPLLSSGAIYMQLESRGDRKPVFSINDGWLSLYEQITNEINKTYMKLLIKSTVMRFFAIYWINTNYGLSEYIIGGEFFVFKRRQFENIAMASYFMEKYSKDILTRKEKKHLFKFTDFEQTMDCASYLGAKLAHEECNTKDAFTKVQEFSNHNIPKNMDLTEKESSDPICKKYFDEQRENWREYAKNVMDKTMTSKCDKKAGKSPKAEKKAGKRLRKD